MKSLGVCLGASTVTFVDITSQDGHVEVNQILSRSHEGNTKQTFLDFFAEIEPNQFDRIVVTGRKFRENVELTTIMEPQAIEYSLDHLKLEPGSYNILVSAGGESTIVYELNEQYKIVKVHMGNKCASGTGEFFLQQIRRMDLTCEQAISMARDQHPHKISGRCSVFCKSDCTHALNIGEPKGSVVAGLCEMIAGKITELISAIACKKIIMTGGVTQNDIVNSHVEKKVDRLFIPEQACYFEALGAALYGLKHKTKPFPGLDSIYQEGKSSFEFLKKLPDYQNRVTFKSFEHGTAKDGDTCILGVDVGSTTTKAILLNKENDQILADIYLRTNGNPVEAARACYQAIKEQLSQQKVKIVALSVTGSGRQIVGLHAFSDCIINEIVCHATASVHFDREVDTIFEIGGQDAKYTYLVNGVPADYAMNEACSAGTGSFLEESAYESLGVQLEAIADLALKANVPPNFNDQCAAFISSDIKVASQEGISREDIVAGLVYSICMNYNNRVKGNRRVGNKIFMQGGVCYNQAIPIAMAALTNKDIIVPPDPGLMGAYGAALEAKKRLDNQLLEAAEFDLDVLINRKVSYGRPFTCQGGAEKCDIGCEILMIIIDGKKYPFGGACNKYYNLLHHVNFNEDKLDLIARREKITFKDYSLPYPLAESAQTIGLNKSFYTNTYYPFYYSFFSRLGLKVVLSEQSLKNGEDRALAPFCYPMILAHGLFLDLIEKKPDYIFMPHIVQLEAEGHCKHLKKQIGYRKSCVFNQGEPYSMKATFKKELAENNIRLLSPLLDFSRGIEHEEKKMIRLAVEELGLSGSKAKEAFLHAVKVQRKYFKELKQLGRQALADLEKNPQKIGVVLFGRPYNAFTDLANLGIPRKFVSRGIEIIPYDILDFENETFKPFMHWAMGETILKASQIVKNHAQLFGTFITNFSCGPDSFLVDLFREEMEEKPSLTLELDSHSADAGINTRIEAFIDVVQFYRELKKKNAFQKVEEDDDFTPTWVEEHRSKKLFKSKLHLSDGRVISADSTDYTFMFPSISRYVMEPGIAYVDKIGKIKGALVPPTTLESIKLGRSQSSSKECLPLAIMLGNVMAYIRDHRQGDEPLLLLHATDTSPCRLEQYYNTFHSFVKRNKIKNLAIVRLDDRQGYAGVGIGLLLTLFKSFVIGDVFEDMKNAVYVLAKDREYGLAVLEEEFQKIIANFGGKEKISLNKRLKLTAERLNQIPRLGSIDEAKFVTITGEIYVRTDHFARRNIETILADKGFIAKVIPFMEVLFYIDHCLMNDYTEIDINLFQKIYFFFKSFSQTRIDRSIKKIFARSGFYKPIYIDIKGVMDASRFIVNPRLRGEVPITTGAALKFILNQSCGAISIGPFACLPSRMVEGLLKDNMNLEHKINIHGPNPLFNELLNMNVKELPFLSIESDGNPFTQVTLAQLEVFCLQADRMHENLLKARQKIKLNAQK